MIGKMIYYYRKLKGLTQEQLASGICSVSHLSKIENGHEIPSDDVLQHLCARLEIRFEEVFSTRLFDDFEQEIMDLYQAIHNSDKNLAKQKYDQLLANADQIVDPDLQLKFRLMKARYQLFSRNFVEAKLELDGLTEYSKNFSPEIEYQYYFFLGIYYYLINDFNEALDHYKKAEKIGTTLRLNDPELYYHIALTYTQRFNISFAINYAYLALEIFNQQYNYGRSMNCEILLGINNNRLNNSEMSEKHYRNALKVAQSTNNIDVMATIYHNLGVLYDLRNPYRAIEHYQTSLKFRNKQKPSQLTYEGYLRTYLCLTKNYFMLEKDEEMNHWLSQAEELASKLPVNPFTMHIKAFRCKAGKYSIEEMERVLKDEVIPYFQERSLYYFVAEYGEILAEHYLEHYKYKLASHYFRLVAEARKYLLQA